MPFIAIAVFIALALGGGVTVAADQAKPGDALYSYKTSVNDSVRHEYHAIQASMSGSANVQASAEEKRAHQDSDDTATTSLSDMPSGIHGALRVRADASDEVKAADDKAEGSGAVNADGFLKVNVY